MVTQMPLPRFISHLTWVHVHVGRVTCQRRNNKLAVRNQKKAAVMAMSKRRAVVDPLDIARVLQMGTNTDEYGDDGDISEEENSDGISDVETSDPFQNLTTGPPINDGSPIQQSVSVQDTTNCTNDSRDIKEIKEVMLEIKDLLQSFLSNHSQPSYTSSQQASTSTSSGMSDCSLTTPTRSKHSVSLNMRVSLSLLY